MAGLTVKTSLTLLRSFSEQSPLNSAVCQKLPSIQNCSLNSAHTTSVCLDPGNHFLLLPSFLLCVQYKLSVSPPHFHSSCLHSDTREMHPLSALKATSGIKTELTCAEHHLSYPTKGVCWPAFVFLFCVC